MSRSKSSSNARRKEQKLFRFTKGFWGCHNNVKKVAKQAFLHALTHSLVDRRKRAGEFRSLWITRISRLPFFLNTKKQSSERMSFQTKQAVQVRYISAF